MASATNAKYIDTSPSGCAIGGLQVAERSLMRSACRVTLHNEVVLRDELIEGDEKVGKGGEEVTHHGRDAFRVHDLWITAGRVMHNLRAKNVTQHDRISTIDHIIVPSSGDRSTLNLCRGWTGRGRG